MQADVAQLVEQLIRNQQVVSSSLTVGSSLLFFLPAPDSASRTVQRPFEFRFHRGHGALRRATGRYLVVHGLSTYFFVAQVVPVALSTHTLGIIVSKSGSF